MSISDYYEQLFAHKLDKLEKIDKFLKIYNLPKLNQEELENLNRSITINSKEIQFGYWISNWNLPQKKITEPNSFVDEFYQTVKEKLIWNPLSFFPKIEDKRIFPNSFY